MNADTRMPRLFRAPADVVKLRSGIKSPLGLGRERPVNESGIGQTGVAFGEQGRASWRPFPLWD
jgi:hypothetical protein